MKICIFGNPIPNKRPRSSHANNVFRTYDPQSSQKKRIKTYLTKKVRELFDDKDKKVQVDTSNLIYNQAYEVSLSFYLPINDSDPLPIKNLKLWGILIPNAKPDLDNLEKFYLDCANEILFPDDGMIIKLSSQKQYALVPRTEINIMAIEKIKLSEDVESILKVFPPNTLQEFVDDINKVSVLDYSVFEKLSTSNKELWLTHAAKMLSCFAQLYSDKLKKIRKFDIAPSNGESSNEKFEKVG